MKRPIIASLALILLGLSATPGARAVTVTISTDYLPDNGAFVAGLGADGSPYLDAVIGGTVDIQPDSGSGIYQGTDSVANEHLSPGTQYSAYLASGDGFGTTIHLHDYAGEQATGFQVEIGTIDAQATTGSGTNWICAGSFCLSGADLIGYVPSWDLGRDLSVTVTGLDPFTSMDFSNSPASVEEVAALSVFRTPIPIPPAAPEASTWVMMFLGFLSLGYAAYRRPCHAAIA